jgi:hypothetical protein
MIVDHSSRSRFGSDLFDDGHQFAEWGDWLPPPINGCRGPNTSSVASR